MSYAEFFLGSKSTVVQLETIEIAHSAFSQRYFIVRNDTQGTQAVLESGATQFFSYYPLRLRPLGIRDDLDFGLGVDLGDLGEILPDELDRVAKANKFAEKPTVTYRVYRSDDLSKILYGPLLLEVENFNMNREGASFEANAPELNITTTGELYKPDRFPMLLSFL